MQYIVEKQKVADLVMFDVISPSQGCINRGKIARNPTRIQFLDTRQLLQIPLAIFQPLGFDELVLFEVEEFVCRSNGPVTNAGDSGNLLWRFGGAHEMGRHVDAGRSSR